MLRKSTISLCSNKLSFAARLRSVFLTTSLAPALLAFFMLVSWTGYAQPSTQASNITIRPLSGQTSQLQFSWTSGTPANKVLVVVSNVTATFSPVTNTAYAAAGTPNFTNDTDIKTAGTGKAVAVYSNTGSTTITVQGLPANVDYKIQIFEYTDVASNELYNTHAAVGNPLFFKAFTSTGLNSWTAPAGVTMANAQVWGAGGGGGNSAGTTNNPGGGGGGGAYSATLGYAVTPGNSYDVQVGAGGAGAAVGPVTQGVTGGDSWFQSNTSSGVLAKGGTRGANDAAIGSGGGAGGSGGAGFGTITNNGGAGANTVTSGGDYGGGGGSSAGTAALAHGTPGSAVDDEVSVAPAGGGNGGGSGSGGGGGTNGDNGFFPGGGGGGSDDNASAVGGNGANGLAIVSYSMPGVPAGLDLATADDLGTSSGDNITSKDDLTINGTGTPGATIQLYNGSAIGTTTTVLANGTWSIVLNNLSEGAYALTATATLGGNTSAASSPALNVTVDLTAPTLAISSTDADAIVRDIDAVTITITLDDDLGTPTIDIGTAGSIVNDGVMTNTDPAPAPVVWTYNWNVPAGNDGAHSVTINLPAATDVAGNALVVSGQTSFTIDNTAPVITNVTIPNTPMKIGDVVTATITVNNDGGQTYTLVSGTIGGFTLGSLSRTNSTTYTAQFTIASGGTNVAAGADIPVSNLILADPATNQSAAYATPISQAGDPIDANAPAGYTVSIDQASITAASQNAVSFTFAGAEVGATYNYSIDDANGGTPAITGSGTVTTPTDQITGINVSSLDDGTLNLTVYLTDPAGNQGSNAIDNVSKDTTPPSGYTVSIDQMLITSGNQNGLSFTFAGAEVGAAYNYSIDDTNGATTAITGNGTVATATHQVTGINVSTLSDGNLTLTIYLTDVALNQGGNVTDNVNKDATAPVVTSITSNATAAGVLKIGDQIIFTATIQTPEAGLTLSPTLYNGRTFSPSWATSNGGATYTATYTVTAGDPDHATALQLTGVTATDAAGNTSATQNGSDVIKTIDANAPAAPAALDLDGTTDDTGTSNTDNITKNTSALTISGTAEANATVELFRAGSVSLGITTASAGGAWSLDITLTEAVHAITARATDAAGNQGIASGALNITVDITAPVAPATPDLVVASDIGSSPTDNVTNDATPQFDGGNVAGVANLAIRLYSNLDGFIGSGTANGSGGYSNINTTLVSAAGILGQAHNITATATDVAGNESVASGGLSMTLDVVAPTIAAGEFFASNDTGDPHLHMFVCNGVMTTTATNREMIHLVISEPLGLADGANISVGAAAGFTVSAGVATLDTDCTGTLAGASVYHSSYATFPTIHLKSVNNNQWSGTTTVSFTATGSTNVKDVAGNEMGTFAGLLPADSQPPALASGLIFAPNGAGAETITFELTESLHSSVGTTPTGFSTVPADPSMIQAYNAGTNTITLTSSANGVWTDAVTVSYTQNVAANRVRDPGGNQMAAFANMPIRLRNVAIISDNANNTARAKNGNTITVSFTTTTPLSATPAVTIGGQSASVSGGPANYTATLIASAALNINGTAADDILNIAINAVAGSEVTDVTATTNGPNGSQMTYDHTAPAINPVTISSNNFNSTARAKTGNTVTLSFTVSETLFGTPAVTIGGRSATVGNSGLNYTATLLLDGTETEGILPFNISLEDQSDITNTATATTNASSVDFNKTPPVVSQINLPSTNPNNTTAVNFQVVFSEAVTAVDAADFTLYGTASGGTASIGTPTGSGTTWTVPVSGISLTGTLGLNVVDNNTINDLHHNFLGGPGANDGNFSSATTYSFILPEPLDHVTNFQVSTFSSSSVTLIWDDVTSAPVPSGYVISAERSGDIATPPANFGSPVSPQPDLINNTTGYMVVGPGIETVTFNTLLSGATYTFKIYPYTNSGANIDFKIGAPVPTVSQATPTATLSSLILNATAVPISSILDGSPVTDKATVMQFTIYDDGQDPIEPNEMMLNLNGASSETVVFTLRDELTASNGASLSGFSYTTGAATGVLTAIYSGKGTSNTITLTSPFNNALNASSTISYNGATGNVQFINLGRMQQITAHPVILSSFTDTFSSPGSYIYTIPPGVGQLTIETWGGGGAGGSGVGGSFWDAGGAGGGGGYSRSVISVTPGNSYSIIVGAGGTASGTNGGNGNLSSFGGGMISANGGEGGKVNTGGNAGAGGLGAGTGIGDVIFSGGSGRMGFLGSTTPASAGFGGGGGSSAGTSANGTNGTSNAGAIAPVGGGNGGSGINIGTGSGGFFPGGGGGGSGNGFGGPGANGQVRITYTQSPVTSSSEWSADNSPFKFSQLIVTQGAGNNAALSNWQDVIAGAELTDGTHTVTGSVGTGNITFSNATDPDTDTDSNPDFDSGTPGDFGYLNDANAAVSSKTYTLKIWLRDDLNNTLAGTIDGMNLAFRVNPADITYDDVSNSNQSSRLISTHPIVQSGAKQVQVVATQLDFTTSPITNQLVSTNVMSVSAAPDNSTVPVIRARDANGNTDLNYNGTVTISNTGTINMLNLNSSPVNSLVASAGRINFPANFQYLGAGNGTLTATAGGLTSGVSNPVVVNYSSLSTITAGPHIETTISSLKNSFTGPDFDFNIIEDNLAASDGSPTIFTQLVITPGSGNDITDWTELIEEAVLFDGTSDFTYGTITANSITFSGLNTFTPDASFPFGGLGYVQDNTTKNYQLWLSLKTTFGGTLPSDVDNKNLVFEVLDENIGISPQSSAFTGSESENSGASNLGIDVDATQLVFTTQPPADVLVNTNLTASPALAARDIRGNLDTDFAAAATISNEGGLTMINTPAAFSGGLLTFPAGFQFTQIGNGDLTVSASGVTSVTSTNVVVRVGVSGTITAGTALEPATISSLIDTDPEKITVFDFRITDDDGLTPSDPQNDGAPMLITEIKITQQASPNNTITDWRDAIAVAELFDGTNTLTGAIGVNNILFENIPISSGDLGHIIDGDNKTYQLRIYLRSALGGPLPATIDGLKFGFQVLDDDIKTDPSGTRIIGTEDENSGAGTAVTVIATRLDFTNAPAGASINTNILPTLQVEARDANGNRDLGFTGPDAQITDFSGLVSMINLPQENNASHVFTSGVYTFPTTFQYTSELIAPNPNENRDGSLHMEAGSGSLPSLSGDSPDIDITSSSESILSFTPSPVFDYNSRLAYINYQDNTSMIPLAGYTLTDGDGSSDDPDGAPTSINSITFEILTNGTPGSSDIRNLALFNGAGTLVVSQPLSGNTITFSGLSGITTGVDFSSGSYAPANFTLRASFKASAADVHDEDVIEVRITNIVMNGGSQLDDIGSVTGGDHDIGNGNVTNSFYTPNNVNQVNVVATQLDFTTQPASPTFFAGINQPITEPAVQARDANAIVDTEVDNITPTVASSANTNEASLGLSFQDGILTFTGLQYETPGNGTLTIGNVPGATDAVSSNVEVLHVEATYAANGVTTAPQLFGGATNQIIFGVTFTAPYAVSGQPKLNEFTISFGNSIQNVIKNVTLYESVDNSFSILVDNPINSKLTITPEASFTNFINFEFLPGQEHTFTSGSKITYFLKVDIDNSVIGTTPVITPSLIAGYTGPTAGNIITSRGNSFANITGQTYGFRDISPPVLVNTSPFNGQLNHPISGNITLTFSEPVVSLDGVISLYNAQTDAFIQDLPTSNPATPSSTTFTFPATLTPNTRYYIKIAKGTGSRSTTGTGFIDDSDNFFGGILNSSTLAFKTSSGIAPTITNPAQFIDVTIHSGNLRVGLDQQGELFYMIVPATAAAPTTIGQIDGSSAYSDPVIKRGSIQIVQPNLYHYGAVSASFAPSTAYKIFMYAKNNDLPTPVSSGILLPSVDFTTPAPPPGGIIVQAPTHTMCSGLFQTVFPPMSFVEGEDDDFDGQGGDFYMILPSGFVFNTTAVNDKVTADGADFSGIPTLTYINSTVVKVSFQNSGSSSLDRLTISGLEVQATSATASGNVTRLAGSAFSSISDGTVLITLNTVQEPEVDFSNNLGSTFISNEQSKVILKPNPSDFGANIFSGSGVFFDTLFVQAAGIGTHNITLTHTYETGCTVSKTNVYTIYDQNLAITGLKNKYCTYEGIVNIPYDGKKDLGLYLTELTVDLPQSVLDDRVFPKGLTKARRSLVQNSIAEFGTFPGPSVGLGAAVTLKSYRFDLSAFNAQEFHDLFTPQEGGGSIGNIEFTATYADQTKGGVLTTVRLTVNVYIPPSASIAVADVALNPTYPDTYCENLNTLTLQAVPAPVSGTRTVTFALSKFDQATNSFILVSNSGILTDLNDGRATINTKNLVNAHGYTRFKVDYDVTSVESGCADHAEVEFNLTPNPVANFDLINPYACIGSDIEFHDLSTITQINNFPIEKWYWDFAEPTNSPEDNLNLIESNTGNNVMHYYAGAATYVPQLTVESRFGCKSAPKTMQLPIGGIPTVDFTFGGVSTEDTFSFNASSSTVSGNDTFDELQWSFGDSQTYVASTNTEIVPHNYLTAGTYQVNLRVVNDKGCMKDLQKYVVVVPKISITLLESQRLERFENSSGGYQFLPTTASWEWGLPDDKVIKETDNRVWTTNRTGAYHPNEESYLYTAEFDFSELPRPIISFDAFVQFDQGDGIVLEYSTDGKNPADPSKQWELLGFKGNVSSGLGWYNETNLPSKPGDQVLNYGWGGLNNTEWFEAKHSLSEIPPSERNAVVFRFAMASVNDEPSADGFALDNLTIGNGTRVVLLENFTNTGTNNTTVVNENAEFRGFQETSVGIDVVKIDYHVGFPGVDPFNLQNPADPGARALYYGISTVPHTRMDGMTFTSPSPLFTTWGKPEFDKRVLDLADAIIDLDPPQVNEGLLTLRGSFTPTIAIESPVVLHVAVVEEQVLVNENPSLNGRIASNENEFRYVLKKMLPNAGGTRYANGLIDSVAVPFGPFEWSSGSLFKPNNDIAVVIFLQDENTRQIYQSYVLRNVLDPTAITSTEDFNETSFKVFPNPADQQMTIELPEAVKESTPLQMFDPMGKLIHESSFQRGDSRKTIYTDDFAAGVYLIQVESDKGMLRKKVMVMHRN